MFCLICCNVFSDAMVHMLLSVWHCFHVDLSWSLIRVPFQFSVSFVPFLRPKLICRLQFFPRVPASRLICSEDPTRVMCPEIQKHTSYLSLLKSHLIFATKHHNKHWGFSSASGIMCTLHICIDSKNQISTICTKVQVVQQVYAQKYENNNTCNLI